MGEINRLSADLEAVRADLSRRAAPPSPPLEPDAIIARIGEQLATLQSWLDDESVDAAYARDVFRSVDRQDHIDAVRAGFKPDWRRSARHED